MREKIINRLIKFIKKYTIVNNENEEILVYGLTSIYILITKSIIIYILAILLNIVCEVTMFIILYNLVRMPSFGLHAKKSSHCLIASTLIFIFIPILCKYIIINPYIKSVIGILLILSFWIFAPADTEKRPIISKKRREIYKTISTIISILFVFASLILNNTFISNCMLFATIIQSIIILPITYKIFKLPYNNYLRYI